MLAIGLALGASVVWGLGDFLGGLKSRGLHVLAVLALSQVAGLAAVAVWLAVSGDERPGLETLGVAAAAGLAGAVGLAALYRGMAVGAMGIVAPISAVSAAIPFSVGVASGERPGAVQLAGVVLALAGVGLASRQPVHLGGGRAAGVGLALLAAAGFGLYFVLFDNAADAGGVPWAVVTARSASSILAVGAALAGGIALAVGRRHLPALVAIGVCDVGANVLFGLATTRGFLSVVSVLAALYPVVTMALAALLLHERIAASQRLGVAGALAGAALITLG
jgi:drug/metabolite transporter (DMT)-like permease